MSSLSLLSQDTSYTGASNMEATFATPPRRPNIPASYSSSSLRRQSSVALSAASRCMPSGFLQRAGSVLGRPKAPAATISEASMSGDESDRTPRQTQTLDRKSTQPTSAAISSISSTAAGWLGMSSISTPAPGSKYTSRSLRPSFSKRNTTSTINEEQSERSEDDDDYSDYDSESDLEYSHSHGRTERVSRRTASQTRRFFSSQEFLQDLPRDAKGLEVALRQLHKAYVEQNAILAATRHEAADALDKLDEARLRIRELEAERKMDRELLQGGTTEQEADWGRDTVRARPRVLPALENPPPLSPSVSMSEMSNDSPVLMDAMFSQPVSERKRRDSARSVASSLPAEDVFWSGLQAGAGRALSGGVIRTHGSIHDENARLKARVCELEDVVDGVLGMVGLGGV